MNRALARKGRAKHAGFTLRKGGKPGFILRALPCLAAAMIFVFLARPSARAQKQGANLKLGRLYFDLSSFFNVEFNDNINSSGLNPLDDIVLRTGVRFDGSLDLSSFNSFSLNFNLGFNKFLNNPQLDSSQSFVDLSDDSELAFEMLIGSFEIRVFDRLGFSADPTDSEVVDPNSDRVEFNILKFSRFNNTLGTSISWDMNSRSRLNATLEQFDVIPLDAQFETTRRTEKSLSLNWNYVFNKDITVGLFTRFSRNDFKIDFQKGSDGFGIGPFLKWQITDFLSLDMRIDYNKLSFDAGGRNGDNSDSSTTNVALSLDHTFNSSYNHRFTFNRETRFGFISNTTVFDRIGYAFEWDLFRKTKLNGSVSYEKGKDSGGLKPEDFNRYGVTIGFGYALSSRLSWNFNYGHTEKTSNIAERGYTQNKFLIGFSYDF